MTRTLRIQLFHQLIPRTPEVVKRISAYQKKYGSPFVQYNSHLSCEQIGPEEMTDIMDWECLEGELAARQKAVVSASSV